MNRKHTGLWIGILLGLAVACGDKDDEVAQVTVAPSVQPSPVIVSATPREKLPTPVPEATAPGGGLEGHGEDLFQGFPTQTPELPTPDVGLESLKEELYLAGGGIGGGGACLELPTDRALPAAELEGHFYHEETLCVWGFPVGQVVTVELYDPQTRLVAAGEFPVENEVEGVGVVDVQLSFAGLPAGDWTVVASSPGTRLKDQFLVSEPKQPILTVARANHIPRAELDVFRHEHWMECTLNPYHAGEQVAVIGAGFPPGRSLPLGIYYLPGGNIDNPLQLVQSLPVTADERGRFTTYVPVELRPEGVRAGSYYTIVAADPGYEPNINSADPLGAVACFQVVWGPGMTGAETILLSSGGGPLDDPLLQEAALDAVNMDRVFEAVRSHDSANRIAFLAQVGDRVVDAYANPYSPAHAKYVLDSAGYPDGLGVLLAFPEADWMLTDLAQVLARELKSGGFYADLVPLPDNALADFEREMRASGQPALWIERR